MLAEVDGKDVVEELRVQIWFGGEKTSSLGVEGTDLVVGLWLQM